MPDRPAVPPLFFNRELSWLDFNARVLREAADERNPLLERLKFAGIFSSNLDEFYMVRVAGLRRQVAAGVTLTPPDGLSPQEQLDAIERRVTELLAQHRELIAEDLLPALAEKGVRLLSMSELSSTEWSTMDAFFESQVFPILTPLAVDPGHPFPYISNLSLSLAVEIRDPADGIVHVARVKVPRSLSRWVPTGRANHFVPLEQVIGTNLSALFSGLDVVGWYPFRITRYSDIDLADVEEPEDLLATIEEQVFQRRFGEVVRLEVSPDMPPHLRALLIEELHDPEMPEVMALTDRDIQETGSLLDLADLLSLACIDVPELRDASFAPSVPLPLRDPARSMFDVIRERDVLVHHPYDSFGSTVERFLVTAANDEHVLAIKMTLYRTSGETAIFRALT